MKRSAAGAGRGGFTLLEMLIVVGVLAILAAIAYPAITSARTRGQQKGARALIERLKLGLESYATDFGDYPPSRLERLGVAGDGKNEGAECLFLCLSTRAKRGPYVELSEGELGNVDGDRLPEGRDPTGAGPAVSELREVVDPWGQPLIYLHPRDYDRGGQVQLPSGAVTAIGERDPAGKYRDLTKFQLKSAGPDGALGGDDDVTSWGE